MAMLAMADSLLEANYNRFINAYKKRAVGK